MGKNIDFMKRCTRYSMNTLFPKNVKNRGIVYTINILHIIGVLYIQLGILLPVWTLKYYILYCTFLLITYVLLKNHCFMSILSNYFSEVNYNLLCIEMDKAKVFLVIYLFLGIMFFSIPKYAPNNIIRMLFKN